MLLVLELDIGKEKRTTQLTYDVESPSRGVYDLPTSSMTVLWSTHWTNSPKLINVSARGTYNLLGSDQDG
jgi:hypothetical protein